MRLMEVNNVFSGYGTAEILHNVSIHVDESEVVTIIGPNGAGKSTLLKTIMGYLTPFDGKILFQEKEVTRLKVDEKVKKGINYVPQLDNVFPPLTVQENLEMGGYLQTKEEMRTRTGMMYGLFPVLQKTKNQKAGTLSGGERKMLAIASALMLKPKLLLLDEPSAGLSPAASSWIFDEIKEIHAAGTAIIIVEQDAYQSLAISNRGYVLAMGQNEFEGSADKILGDERILKTYLGG